MDSNLTPEIDYSVCNNCGKCIEVCNQNVLRIVDGKVQVIHPENCNGEGDCAENCPLGCIWID